MADWTFEFIDSTQKATEQTDKLSSVIPDTIGSGIGDKSSFAPDKNNKRTFEDEFSSKIERSSIRQYIISPLNTVTGGLATPIYQSARKLVRGATIGAVAGDLVATGIMMAVSAGINALQNRIKNIEEKVTELGNNDNALIRAGAVSTATYYSRNFLGIKQTTNRRY